MGQCRRSISQLHHRCSISIIGIAILCCCLNTGGYAASENAQKSEPTRCPPDGSRIALFSRQAIDQGREQENKEYARFTEELFAISTSSSVEGEVVEKSIVTAINFSKKMRAGGHEVGVADLIIDREKIISDLLANEKSQSGIRIAQLELQRAVVREMKAIVCR